MGLEAECTVRVGRKASKGKALLEGETLVIRADPRLDLPFDRMQSVAVDGDDLVVRTDDHEVRLELGAASAERWARYIKEPKSLFEKLELGPESRVAVVDVSDSLFLTALRDRTASVVEGRVPEGAPIILFGADSPDALRKVPLLRARMIPTGTLWIIRPKGGKAVSERDVLDAQRTAGLVETKVVAFSRTHTAHKCVIPVELRGQVIRPRPPIVSLPPPEPGSQAALLEAKGDGSRADVSAGAPRSVRTSAKSAKKGGKGPRR